MTQTDITDTTVDLSKKAVVLATDLDGTFLGGPDISRSRLYDWIEKNRASVGLVFVTGRDPNFIRQLTRKEGVPRPDYVIGDVGTTIASFDSNDLVSPIEELEADIAKSWGDSGARIQAKLHNNPGLRLQSTGFRYRLSYDMDPETFDRSALDIVAEMGLDALISDNRFFDVLPKGVSKGPSLLRLLTHLGVANERCLVAGDTLNDLSMLSLGLPAVAVANSEPALVEALQGHDHVHFAKGDGAAGIAEALLAMDALRPQAA